MPVVNRLKTFGVCGVAVAAVCWAARVEAKLIFVCREDNDLYGVVKSGDSSVVRRASIEEALVEAQAGDGVLLLADGYPDTRVSVDDTFYEGCRALGLKLYIEYPSALPKRVLAATKRMSLERAVVQSDFFGAKLPALRILAINGLELIPLTEVRTHLAAAHVAGFDSAVYGMPAASLPILAEVPDYEMMVATTQLSRFIRARFAPQEAWQTLWSTLLHWLQPQQSALELSWQPVVAPRYNPHEPLPDDAKLAAIKRGCEWFAKAGLFLEEPLPEFEWQIAEAEAATMRANSSTALGLFGVREGLESRILADGSQPLLPVRRGDCTAEVAMALAFGGHLTKQPEYRQAAINLLDYYLFKSCGIQRERADPKHGGYGLIAWGVDDKRFYGANYGDDNARVILGTLAAAALTGQEEWEEPMLRCIMANLRTSGRYGFRGGNINLYALGERGWPHYFQRENTNFSAHFESYLWACYLWAYHKTGDELFYQRAVIPLRMMMEHYTDEWVWTNGLSQEKARILLPLAWLVRVKDTPQHRAWLRQAVDGVVELQDACGAICEEIGLSGKGRYPPPANNEGYGKTEASLIQENGDPVTDLLYTANFAFLGLHEAAAVGDAAAATAAEKLADFLCRVQVRSERQPAVDGGWFRAFDFARWEAWASNADSGWGAWTIESGWTQGWIVSVLALRQMEQSLWELTAQSGANKHFEKLRKEMWPLEAQQRQLRLVPWEPRLNRVALDKPLLAFHLFGEPECVTDKLRDYAEYECVYTVDGSEVKRQPLSVGVNTVELNGVAKGDHSLTTTIILRESGAVVFTQTNSITLVEPAVVETNGHRRLNNLVTEVLSCKLVAYEGAQVYNFYNPREGWVHIAVSGATGERPVVLELAGFGVLSSFRDNGSEAFRYLPIGLQTVAVRGAAAGATLTVRAISEIFNYPACSDSFVPQNGCYGWEFQKRYVFPAVTTLNGGSIPPECRDQFKAYGLRWLANLLTHELIGGDDLVGRLQCASGMSSPEYAGLTCDEQGFYQPTLPFYSDGLRGYENQQQRLIYTWVVDKPFIPSVNNDFISAALNAAGGRGKLLYEAYCISQPDEAAARQHLDKMILQVMQGINQYLPAAASGVGIILGNFNQVPIITLDVVPEVDYKYYLDMQLNMVANHGAFANLGVTGYWGSYYGDEELYRWSFALMRHYGVEGRTNMLSESYGYRYAPGHLHNCDFIDGLTGWEARAASDGTLEPGSFKDYGRHRLGSQGRWHVPPGTGDTFALFKRQAHAPNTLAQQASGLKPGEVYTLQFVTADYQDMLQKRFNPREHGLAVTLEGGAEVMREHSYTFVDRRNSGRKQGDGLARVNLHHVRFRATGTECTVQFSDAPAAVGSELALNYIMLKPYFDDAVKPRAVDVGCM